MKTVMTHFYNEEYLLPWWIKHHQKYFDHGILIDHNSTDNSIDIIRHYAPNWTIVKTGLREFDSIMLEQENNKISYMMIEEGWRITLNTTEFIVGDFTKLDNYGPKTMLSLRSNIMVDDVQDLDQKLSHDDQLTDIKRFGIRYEEGVWDKCYRWCRGFSNYFAPFAQGRHLHNHDNEEFDILWYGFSPMTHELIKRKLQIASKVSRSDIAHGFGKQHFIKYDEQMEIYKKNLLLSEDLSDLIDR